MVKNVIESAVKHNEHSSEFVIFHLLSCELLAKLIIKYLQQKL